MNKVELDESKYEPPTKEELTFSDDTAPSERVEQLEKLIEKQLGGIELGIRPANPRGLLPEYLLIEWRSKVWNSWQKTREPVPRHVGGEGQQKQSRARSPFVSLKKEKGMGLRESDKE